MEQGIRILAIAIGLSMDAFSLSILYGTLHLSVRKARQLSGIVALYHFFMPLFGYAIGRIFLTRLLPHPEYLVGAIFTVLSLQMLISLKKEEEVLFLTNLFSLLLFGFTVSIDSFSVGLGLGALHYNLLFCSVTFSLVSGLFTYIGLGLGAKCSEHFGKYATLFGSLLLLFLALTYFF